jgi:hypothetical protein
MVMRRAFTISILVVVAAIAIWGTSYVRGHWYMGGAIQFPDQAIAIGERVCLSEYPELKTSRSPWQAYLRNGKWVAFVIFRDPYRFWKQPDGGAWIEVDPRTAKAGSCQPWAT